MEKVVELQSIQEQHRQLVMPMVQAFYESDAVDHPVEGKILEDSFSAVVKQDQVWGYLLRVAEDVVGYAYVTTLFSCEVGGLCLFIEEIYVLEPFQGKGYGKQALRALMEKFPKVKRVRLEVTPSNEGAKKLYASLGFDMLPYEQMVLDLTDGPQQCKRNYVEKVRELRAKKEIHHNCNQAVLLTFAEEMGMSEGELQSLGANFGMGMGCKYTCGAVTGGLLALGAMGFSKGDSKHLMDVFLEEFGSHQCDALLAQRAKGGATCDDLIVFVVETLAKMQEDKPNLD